MKATATSITVEIAGVLPGQKGFAVQPRRWAIQRTFGRLGRRRLARDHEATAASALAFVLLAAAMVVVGRWARAP